MAQIINSLVDCPGTFIEEELEARGWTQADLAYILGWDAGQLNKLIKGITKITPDSAVALGDAFDQPPEFFMNLQKLYDLANAKQSDPGVRTRAAWAKEFPVREMIRRGWIENAEPALLDLQMLRFFGKNRIEDVPFVSDAPVYAHAPKKTGYEEMTAIQFVWLSRVRKIAEAVPAPLYSEEALRNALPSIRAHMVDAEDLALIPNLLLKCGVRLVYVEHLPGSKIDGVCVWIDGQPVIGLSLRLDRFDNFCFTLRHELEHVLRGDGREASFTPVDEQAPESDSDDRPECEKIADDEAAEFCIPQELFTSFLLRKSPFIAKKDIVTFAARLEINPAVVAGQIQKRTRQWHKFREFLVSIRERLLEEWPHKDGWGHAAPTNL
jgi:HTH-type transcriptional regulator/antitoxin HigA